VCVCVCVCVCRFLQECVHAEQAMRRAAPTAGHGKQHVRQASGGGVLAGKAPMHARARWRGMFEGQGTGWKWVEAWLPGGSSSSRGCMAHSTAAYAAVLSARHTVTLSGGGSRGRMAHSTIAHMDVLSVRHAATLPGGSSRGHMAHSIAAQAAVLSARHPVTLSPCHPVTLSHGCPPHTASAASILAPTLGCPSYQSCLLCAHIPCGRGLVGQHKQPPRPAELRAVPPRMRHLPDSVLVNGRPPYGLSWLVKRPAAAAAAAACPPPLLFPCTANLTTH